MSWRRFWRHFGEMMLAMVLGMVVFGGVLALALLPMGMRVTDASVDIVALLMAVQMTLPMVAWMHFKHRMAPARSTEMAASMVVPTLLAIALYGAGALAEDAVLLVQHAVMVPAMLAVMLWRGADYSHAH